ncbi:MAG: collagen-like protein [Flavisolibacter sp.]|nr:collagen-like protein [Flavisolibacter sp.]
MKKLSFLSLCFSAIVLIVSCKKEGPMGPVGPQGAAGTNGTNGEPGATGPQGPAGSANVVYSSWSDSALAWTDTTINTVPLRTSSLSASAVTQEIIDRGVVLVYGRTEDGDVHALPTMLHGTDGTNIFRFSLKEGSIALAHSRLVNTGYQTPAAQDIRFRYILIPGGVANTRIASGAAAGYTAAQLQAMSYNEVVALLRIPN